MKIGFIGAGNMGYAMMKGGQKTFKNCILYTDVSKERCAYVEDQLGIFPCHSNHELVQQSDMIVLAIKPHCYASVLAELQIPSSKIIISIAPGLPIDCLRKWVQGTTKIVRGMPNTPVFVGEGMSGVTFGTSLFTEDEKNAVISLFQSFGEVVEIPETWMDAIVPVSGSSPAYVYLMIEAMADGAVLQGIPRDLAYKLAAQSVLGAATMVLETGEHPGVLKDQVCSPKGTTIAAVQCLEKNGFRSAVIEAMECCYKKVVMGKEIDEKI